MPPKPKTPEPLNPKPLNPKPLNPKPLNPKSFFACEVRNPLDMVASAPPFVKNWGSRIQGLGLGFSVEGLGVRVE